MVLNQIRSFQDLFFLPRASGANFQKGLNQIAAGMWIIIQCTYLASCVLKKNNLFSECWPFSPVHFQNIAFSIQYCSKITFQWWPPTPHCSLVYNQKQESMFTKVWPFFCHDVIHLVTHLWCFVFLTSHENYLRKLVPSSCLSCFEAMTPVASLWLLYFFSVQCQYESLPALRNYLCFL